MNVRAVHGSVTPGGRAVALPQEEGVIHFTNHHAPARSGNLRMTLQTRVGITLQQQLAVHRSVRNVTSGAPFPHRFVLEDKVPRLLFVTLGAGLIQLGHSQSTRRLHNILPVGIVTIDAVHLALEHRMMRGQAKLRVHPHVTTEASLR